MNRSNKIFAVIIFLLALAIFIFFIYQNWNRILDLETISIIVFLRLGFLVLFSTFLNGLINYFLFNELKLPVDLITGIGLATINTMANQLPFSGGLFAKGLYLKHKHDFPFSKYFSATAALYICFLATNGLLGLLSTLFLVLIKGVRIPIFLPLGFGLMMVSISVLFITISPRNLPKRLQKLYHNTQEGWLVYKDNSGLLVRLILIQVASVFTMAIRFWISLKAFSQNISFIESVLSASATILTRLVSIVPGGVGIREGIVAFIAKTGGYDPIISAVAIGFDRLISTILILLMGIFFSVKLGKSAFEK